MIVRKYCEYCKKETQHLFFNSGQKQCQICGKGNKKDASLEKQKIKTLDDIDFNKVEFIGTAKGEFAKSQKSEVKK